MKSKKLFFAVLLPVALIWYVVAAKPLSYKPRPEALEIFRDSKTVFMKNQGLTGAWYIFTREGPQPAQKGFIFYPGGLVDPRAYAPMMHALARRGYLAVIASMPLDLAVLGYGQADTIMRTYTDVKTWAIGGHSLGGAMACRYVRQNSDKVKGVVLWASYPSNTFSLADIQIKVISIYGSNDGLATPAKIENSKKDLPREVRFVELKGGNHTQFGWYGEGEQIQRGDKPAGISRNQQQHAVIEATVDFLDAL